MSKKKMLDPARFGAIIQEMHDESDRACAIIGGALIDELLLRLLKHVLLPDTSETVFDFTGSLGSFSARVNLSYGMGLITKDEFSDMLLVRSIRNDFAHGIDMNYSFSTPTIHDKAMKLAVVSLLYDIGSVFDGLFKGVERMWQQNLKSDARLRFVSSIGLLASLLEDRATKIPTVSERKSSAEN